MIWFTIIAALLPLLIELVKWLANLKTAHGTLTGKQRTKLNQVLKLTRQLDSLATEMGCDPP